MWTNIKLARAARAADGCADQTFRRVGERAVSIQASGAFGGPRGGSGEESRGEREIDSLTASTALQPIRADCGWSAETERTTTSMGGGTAHLVGGASKPRFNLIGDVVEP